MSQAHPIYPHGELNELTPGLWQLRGSLPMPLPRNMTVLRRPGGELLLYSVIALQEEGMRRLEALGRPAVMVVPHYFHVMDAPFYAARYPELKVLAPPDVAARLQGRLRVDGGLEAMAGPGLRARAVPGMKYQEVMLDVDLEAGGRALVFTDVLSKASGGGSIMSLLGPPGGRGIARIVRWRQVNDKPALKRFLLALADEPGLKLLCVAHGVPEAEDVPGFLRHAAGQL